MLNLYIPWSCLFCLILYCFPWQPTVSWLIVVNRVNNRLWKWLLRPSALVISGTLSLVGGIEDEPIGGPLAASAECWSTWPVEQLSWLFLSTPLSVVLSYTPLYSEFSWPSHWIYAYICLPVSPAFFVGNFSGSSLNYLKEGQKFHLWNILPSWLPLVYI